MGERGLKLTTYFDERDRTGDRLLADALTDVYARHRVHSSALLRGIEGFGAKHRLQTQRLLSLSEDLPVIATAVDCATRLEAVLGEVTELRANGLVTVAPTRLLGAGEGEASNLGLAATASESARLTVYVGRRQRVGGLPAHRAVVASMHRGGMAGATVLLGVDGTRDGERRRARLLSANTDVPLMVIGVGDGEAVARVVAELSRLPVPPALSLQEVQICKRDGQRLGEPRLPALSGARGHTQAQQLTVYVAEQDRQEGAAVYGTLVRRLRRQGALGATAVRGLWGYVGEGRPHGERVWSVRRHVPVMVVIVDRPQRIGRWFEIVDEVTARAALVTGEPVSVP